MEIKVQKLSQDELEKKGVFGWPIWEKEVSRFPWSYDSIEECYFLAGEVTVDTKDGKSINFGKGDFVSFPIDPCITNARFWRDDFGARQGVRTPA